MVLLVVPQDQSARRLGLRLHRPLRALARNTHRHSLLFAPPRQQVDGRPAPAMKQVDGLKLLQAGQGR